MIVVANKEYGGNDELDVGERDKMEQDHGRYSVVGC